MAVASIGDPISMKRAAGRAKDRVEVGVLLAIQAEMEPARETVDEVE